MNDIEIKDFIEKEFKNYRLTHLEKTLVNQIFRAHVKLIEKLNHGNLSEGLAQAQADNIKASIVNSINMSRIKNGTD